MVEVMRLVVVSLMIGLLFVIPGIFLERWLAKNGIVPDRTWSLVIGVYLLTAVKQIWFQEISWCYFVTLMVLAMTLGIHRGDYWITFRKGRWWWKEED